MAATIRSVLVEDLDLHERKVKRWSKTFRMLEPLPGFQDQWQEEKDKCEILRELIRAHESEPVRRAMADWQKEVMAAGGAPERLSI